MKKVVLIGEWYPTGRYPNCIEYAKEDKTGTDICPQRNISQSKT